MAGTPTLYWLHATGCPACSEMEPFVDAFAKKNGHRLPVIKADLMEVEWAARNWAPEVTPTLVLLRSDGERRVHEGAITEVKELNEWIRAALE
jgi:thiol-disulfide isomerase/thioredoxin